MCNTLHGDFTKIKPNGFGYKIFDEGDSPCFGVFKKPYSMENSWIKWDMGNIKDGFCFFTSKKEAIRLLKDLREANKYKRGYNTHYIKRIKYKQGLGLHNENNITNKGEIYIIAICKEFQILGKI